jgi:flagellar motor switch protein FliM
MTNRAGTMSLCIPFNVIEPLMEELNAQSWFMAGQHRGEHEWERLIGDRLADATLGISALLAETTLTLSELRHLDVGDLVLTGKPANSPVVLTVENSPKYLAHIGQFKGKRALRIIRSIKPTDRL